MSAKRKRNRPDNPPPAPANKRGHPRAMVLLIAAPILAFAGLMWWATARPTMTQQPPPAALATGATNRATHPADASAVYMKLKGRWQRPDGGYVIEVKGVDDAGRMDAAYYNPRPIHVARAEASREDAMVKVFIELRDEKYPGSTYTLTYDPPGDRLAGIYYQAALRQNFEVVFSRIQ